MTRKIETIEFVWHAQDNMDTKQNLDMIMPFRIAYGHTEDARFIAMEEWT